MPQLFMADKCCIQILVLEDEEDLCDMAEFAITELNCFVHKANSINQALELLEKFPKIKFGIFDFHLPDSENAFKEIEGSFLNYIKKIEHFEFVFATGDYGLTSSQAKELGAVDIIHKPFTLEELQTITKSIVQRKNKTSCTHPKGQCPVPIF